MFLSNANKARIYYVYFKNPETNKITSRSCRTKKKSEAVKFMRLFQIKKTDRSSLRLLDVRNPLFTKIEECCSKNTYRSYNLSFTHFVRITGNKIITDVSKNDIEAFKSARIKEVKPVSVNIDIRNIKAMFNRLLSMDLLEYSKISSVKEYKLIHRKFLSISSNEISILFESINDLQLRQIVRFSLMTANRISETLGIKMKDIDNESGIISIFQTKTNKYKYIPLTDNLKILIQEITKGNYTATDCYLFNNNGTKLRSDYVSKRFKKAIKDSGLNDNYKFHSLRHTAITELIKNKVPIAIVKEIAGHRSVTTTMLYTHISISEMELLKY